MLTADGDQVQHISFVTDNKTGGVALDIAGVVDILNLK
jgi:hypothetical protein